MNRPNKKDDPNYPWEFPDTYLSELEKYCDKLEKALVNASLLLDYGFGEENVEVPKNMKFYHKDIYEDFTTYPYYAEWLLFLRFEDINEDDTYVKYHRERYKDEQ